MASGPPSHNAPARCWETPAWTELHEHVGTINDTHLRDLLDDSARCEALTAEYDGVFLDYSRQRVTAKTMALLCQLSDQTGLTSKIAAMYAGEHINVTENRAVLHMALRVPLRSNEVQAKKTLEFAVHHRDVVAEVLNVRRRVRDFTQRVRAGMWRGVTGRLLVDVVSVGIGGSYLGPEFVYEALRTEPHAALASGNFIKYKYKYKYITTWQNIYVHLYCT